MTRRNNCLLPCPSDKGEAYNMDSMAGLHWTYDSFFDGIDDEIEDWGGNQGNLQEHQKSPKLQSPCDDREKLEAVFDSEEIVGLDCPPMDKAYFNCEPNFNWMMDGNLFDNDATADSKATRTSNKNKGSLQGKGKPQSLAVLKLHAKGKPQSLAVLKLHAKGKPQSLVVPKLQPICEDKEYNNVSYGRGKEMKRVIDLYGESELLKKPAYGKDKVFNILDVGPQHTDNRRADYESCTTSRFERVKNKKKVVAANVELSYESKLEISKRKLQDNYQQSKKLRQVQLIGQKDVPKPCNESVSSFRKRICKSSTVKQRLAKKLRVMGRKVC